MNPMANTPAIVKKQCASNTTQKRRPAPHHLPKQDRDAVAALLKGALHKQDFVLSANVMSGCICKKQPQDALRTATGSSPQLRLPPASH
jgi:hypothetical protein